MTKGCNYLGMSVAKHGDSSLAHQARYEIEVGGRKPHWDTFASMQTSNLRRTVSEGS